MQAGRAEWQYVLLFCLLLPSVQRCELLHTQGAVQLQEEELIQEEDREAQLAMDMETELGFVYSFCKDVLSLYSMPGPHLNTMDVAVNKTYSLPSWSLYS